MKFFAIDNQLKTLGIFYSLKQVLDWIDKNDFFQILHQENENKPFHVYMTNSKHIKKDFYADMRRIGIDDDTCVEVLEYFAGLTDKEIERLREETPLNT